jgi:stringent starvation protein B
MYDPSTKPYLIRAIYEWCVDQSYTPYIAVQVDSQTKVPMEFVKDGQIILNVSYTATRHLKIDNDFIHFSARFSGVSRELEIPISAVMGVFAKESGQGMFFQMPAGEPQAAPSEPAAEGAGEGPPSDKPPRGSHLKVVK